MVRQMPWESWQHWHRAARFPFRSNSPAQTTQALNRVSCVFDISKESSCRFQFYVFVLFSGA